MRTHKRLIDILDPTPKTVDALMRIDLPASVDVTSSEAAESRKQWLTDRDTKGILGEKLGMTQVFDENNRIVPVTVVKAGPCVVTQIRTPEKDGYTAVQLAYGADRPAQSHQAGCRPLQGSQCHSAAAPGRAAHRLDRGLRGRPGARRRRLRRRAPGRRHRHDEGQGHRRRHEASRLRRPRRRPRDPAQAPRARFDRRLCHAGPGLQRPAHGRPDGPRAPDHAEPAGAKVDTERGLLLIRGAVPGPNGGLVLVRTAAKGVTHDAVCHRPEPGRKSPASEGRAARRSLRRPTNIALIHQVVVAQLAAARQGTHSTKTRGEVRGGGAQAVPPEGHRAGPAGLDPRAAVRRRRRGRTARQPRSYDQRTPKKMKAAALRGALSDRARHDRVHVVTALVSGDAPSTRTRRPRWPR